MIRRLTTTLQPPLRLARVARHRWECAEGHDPILLARYDDAGVVEIRMRDRVYITMGCVHAICPRCGREHVLDIGTLVPAHADDRQARP